LAKKIKKPVEKPVSKNKNSRYTRMRSKAIIARSIKKINHNW